MLDAFIIEQLKKIERRRHQERRPQVELPCDLGDEGSELPGKGEGEVDEKSHVIIIDYGA